MKSVATLFRAFFQGKKVSGQKASKLIFIGVFRQISTENFRIPQFCPIFAEGHRIATPMETKGVAKRFMTASTQKNSANR